MKSNRSLAVCLIATSQILLGETAAAQEWTPADEVVHSPTPTTDPQGFNFVSGGYCVSEPLSNFPEGATRLSLSLSFCMPVIKGCDDGGPYDPDCPDQVVANRNKNPGAILHNSLSATGWGKVSYVGEGGRVHHSISMPTASGISSYQSGFLYNANGTRIREGIGLPFVSTLQDAQQNSLADIDSSGARMTAELVPAGRIVTTEMPDGEILRSYLQKGVWSSDGHIYSNYRLRYITSNRGYAQHITYSNNVAGSDAWLSMAGVWQYRSASHFCQPSSFADCASVIGSGPPLVSFAYSSNGMVVDIDSSFRGRRQLTFSVGPGGGAAPDYRIYEDLVLVRDERLDVPNSARVIEYGNPVVGVSLCDRCDDVGAQPYYASRITTPTGVWSYLFETEVSPLMGEPSETRRTNPDGSLTRVEAAKGVGSVYWTKDANGLETRTDLTSYSRPTAFRKLVSGTQVSSLTLLERDFRGNITEQKVIPIGGSSADALVTTQTFPTDCSNIKTCNLPTRIVDPKGAATDFSYDSVHGGLLSAMGPPAQAGGARPLALATWGQRYAWELTSSGSLVQSSEPIWVKLSETLCQTTSGANPSPVCDSNEPVLVTSYEYGADGTRESLFVKGVAITSDGETLRSCFTYDAMGRKLSETKPRANLASCNVGGV